MKTIKLLLIVILFLFTAHSLWAKITIMPLGDSITYDSRRIETRPIGQRTAYRQLLYLDLKAAGYDVDFVGSQVAGQDANPPFDPDNEGHPGWQADGDPVGRNIAPNVYNWLSAHPADVILLHIGTNDISIGQEPAGIASEINEILSEIDRYETDNGVKIWVILARIINRPDSLASATTDLNNHIQLVADTRIGAGDDIIVVDMEKDAGLIYSIDQAAPYDDGDMYDQFHPNISGYEKMAVKWLVDGLLTILPQADAGADLSVNEKTLVTLDGSWSVDPDEPAGNPLFFSWKQESGTDVLISNPTAQKPTFTAPEVGAIGDRLGFQLTVTDADGFENSDTVFVDIENVFVQPVANAGPDQIVPENKMITLNGSDSHDPDGMIVSFEWEQVSGKAQVTLTNPNELTTDFIAPEVDSDGDILTFKFTVRDNDDLVSSDTVTISVKNGEAPVADAGMDKTVTAGNIVTLNGSSSRDPDGTISSVQWEQISGKSQVTLTNTNELTTDFIAPEVDSDGDVQMFKLTVKDNDGLVSEDTVTVTIAPAAVSATSSNGGGSGGGCFIQSVIN